VHKSKIGETGWSCYRGSSYTYTHTTRIRSTHTFVLNLKKNTLEESMLKRKIGPFFIHDFLVLKM